MENHRDMADKKMSDDMVSVWQSLLSRNYAGQEADVLAALVAVLLAKGVITREELDSLEEMSKSMRKKK